MGVGREEGLERGVRGPTGERGQRTAVVVVVTVVVIVVGVVVLRNRTGQYRRTGSQEGTEVAVKGVGGLLGVGVLGLLLLWSGGEGGREGVLEFA